MSDTVIVPLNEMVDPDYGLFLKQIEWWDEFSRFVVVKYALKGEEPDFGLRIDLDKRIFLDHLNDASLDAKVQGWVAYCCDLVSHSRQTKKSEDSPPSSYRQVM